MWRAERGGTGEEAVLPSQTNRERAQAPCLAAGPELAGPAAAVPREAAGARQEPQGSAAGVAEEPRSSPGEAKPSGATSRLRRLPAALPRSELLHGLETDLGVIISRQKLVK